MMSKQGFDSRSFSNATHAFVMLSKCICCVAPALFLLSCSTIHSSRSNTSLVEAPASPLSYSIIFIIHGDGGYLYHDSLGVAYRANEEALAGAKRVAEQNPQAEVFIFHQRRRRHLFKRIKSRRDGTFYYYRNGQLLASETYWRNRRPNRFDPEVDLYNRFRAGERPDQVRFFLYLGHEIPEFERAGYDASYAHQTFTVDDLAGGLARMTHDSKLFDLVVLSTCFNGTPHTVGALAPYARFIMASPENLHLSYFDLESFERLDVGLRDGDVSAFAETFAHNTFNRLTEDLQTAVTVALYEVDRVEEFVQAVDSTYNRTLTTVSDKTPVSLEHVDCAEDPVFTRPEMREGVSVFYRPSHFGRAKHKESHSGWECWRLVE